MKVSEIISAITNDVKGYNLDDKISKRYILSKLVDRAALYIKRENELLRLFNYQDIWVTVDCVEMVPADIVECCCIKIDKCTHFVKSKLPIPTLYSFKGGPLIREVMSLDGTYDYKLTTPRGYKRILDREFNDNSIKYFWFENDHLVIPNSQTKIVSLTAFPQDVSKFKQLSTCDTDNTTCINPLEEDFLCPPHLLSIVKEDVIKDLINFNRRIIEDELPDDDTNKKQGKPNQ